MKTIKNILHDIKLYIIYSLVVTGILFWGLYVASAISEPYIMKWELNPFEVQIYSEKRYSDGLKALIAYRNGKDKK
jgi:hypothetical protein